VQLVVLVVAVEKQEVAVVLQHQVKVTLVVLVQEYQTVEEVVVLLLLEVQVLPMLLVTVVLVLHQAYLAHP
jgi:hypothetical protein